MNTWKIYLEADWETMIKIDERAAAFARRHNIDKYGITTASELECYFINLMDIGDDIDRNSVKYLASLWRKVVKRVVG